MPSSLTLGAPVQQIDVLLMRNSDQSFALEMTDDQGEPAPPSGAIQLEFDDGTIWVGTTGGDAGNVVTWTLQATETNPTWTQQGVKTVRIDGTARVVLGAGTARCVP